MKKTIIALLLMFLAVSICCKIQAKAEQPARIEPCLVLSDGTKVYSGQTVAKSELADAKFSLGGLGEGTYWFVNFCDACEYHVAEDPQAEWAYSAQYNAGDMADISFSAKTCNEAYSNWMYIGMAPVNGGGNLEYNFKLQ